MNSFLRCKLRRLCDALAGAPVADPKVLVASIDSAVNDFSDFQPNTDDICMLALRYSGIQDFDNVDGVESGRELMDVTMPVDLGAFSSISALAEPIVASVLGSARAQMYRLGLMELLANIGRHGCPDAGADGGVRLTLRSERYGVSTKLVDTGTPFDVSAYGRDQSPPSPAELLAEWDPSKPTLGLGVALANTIFDAIHYERHGRYNVTTLLLVKEAEVPSELIC